MKYEIKLVPNPNGNIGTVNERYSIYSDEVGTDSTWYHMYLGSNTLPTTNIKTINKCLDLVNQDIYEISFDEKN